MNKGEYHAYLKIYRKNLDKVCTSIGIDEHLLKVYDKNSFDCNAAKINGKILEMFHAGQSYGYNYRSESANVLKKIEDRIDAPRIYLDTTIDKNDEPQASVQDIVGDFYNAFNTGIAYSSMFKKRMQGKKFLEKLVEVDKTPKIYKMSLQK